MHQANAAPMIPFAVPFAGCKRLVAAWRKLLPILNSSVAKNREPVMSITAERVRRWHGRPIINTLPLAADIRRLSMTEPSTPAPSTAASRWSPFRHMEELSFMRTPEGWVFQAPNLWLVGPRRQYLVNDTQKSEIAAQLRRMWTLVTLTIVSLVTIGLPLWMSFIGDGHPIAMLGISLLVGTVAGMMVCAYVVRRLRAVIATLEPTTRRITQREAILRQTQIFSRARIVFFGLLSATLLTLQLVSPLVLAGSWNVMTVFGVALFGAMTLYWSALFVVKYRAERSAA